MASNLVEGTRLYEERFAATKGMDPTSEFHELRSTQTFEEPRFIVDESAPRQGIRIVAISDTHNKHDQVQIPEGDILVHTGDMTLRGTEEELLSFAKWFAAIEGFDAKIVIAGNHDLSLDTEQCEAKGTKDSRRIKELFLETLGDASYLEDSSIHLHGLHIYGAPWQPYFEDWAFQLGRGAPCAACWAAVPDTVDVLLTHGPPLGRGDLCFPNGRRAGCRDLLRHIQSRIKPYVHIFGHIHEATTSPSSDGVTDFINASTCNIKYRPLHPPVLLDLPRSSERSSS